MIDTTRPLQLSDGTPVVLAESNVYGESYISVSLPEGTTRTKSGLAFSGNRRFTKDGLRPVGDAHPHIRLENVPGALQLDVTKPLQTRGGFAVSYVATVGDRLIIEITRYGTKELAYRNLDGTSGNLAVTGKIAARTCGSAVQDMEDVINVDVTTIEFVNVYADGSTGTARHKTRDDAAARSKVGQTRVGILKLVTRNGEFFGSTYEALKPHRRTTGRVLADAAAQPYGRTLDVTTAK